MLRANLIIVSLAFGILLLGCRPPAPDLSFQGTWKTVKEETISGEVLEATVKVTVQGKKFRIVSSEEGIETVTTYDGQLWTEKVISHNASPKINQGQKQDNQMESMRFWSSKVESDRIPGGRIAGRDTFLYQAQSKLPSGTMTVQAWVDSQTGIVLKKIFTNYSNQAEQVMRKKMEECQEIQFGPIDANLFLSPS